jgi:predicted negative regulator of RcsB-dependent stress response
MDIYLSEEERIEALKKWWQENAKAIAAGLIIGIALILGWNAWQKNQRAKSEEASVLFQQLGKAVESKQTEPAIKLAERLIEKYQGTPYAPYAILYLVKLKVDAGDLAGAKKPLQDLLASTKDDGIRHIARLRLGEVMMALGESKDVLPFIENIPRDQLGEFESRYEILKGDLYADLKRPREALLAYEKAKRLGEATPLLELKIIDLATESPQSGE